MQPLLLVADFVAIVAAGVLMGPSVAWLVLTGALTGVLYKSAGLYRSRLTISLLDDLPALIGRGVVAAALVASLHELVELGPGDRLVATLAVGMSFILLLRLLAYSFVTRLRRRRVVAHATLILGAGDVGGQVARLLLDHREYGLRPVGFLDADPRLPASELPLPLLGSQQDLARMIGEHQVDDVVIAFGALRESEMVDLVRTCDRLHCEIFYVPRLFELHHTTRDMDQIWGLPLIRLRRAAFRTPSWRLKRAIDFSFAAGALLTLSPLLGIIALAVRLDGGRGVLFRQQRVGLDGREFQLLKFRSMLPASQAPEETTWNVSDDDRLTPVGRVLRRTSLDELPQLLNIIRGEMSLVGPRPERPHFVSQFARTFPRYPARHRVPSGLTGWAQVHGLRGDTSIGERARFDNCYIENWSVWADIKILLRTVLSVLRREGS